MDTVAIVPVKALGDAKGRLAASLDPEQRRELVAWMLDKVLSACCTARGIDRVLVIAGDDAAASLAVARDGVDVMVVSHPGLSAALTVGDRETATAGTTIVVAADLPLLVAADLEALLAAAGDADRAVVVARTEDGGTGALLRRPPHVISTAFGGSSAGTHMSLARGAGLHPVRVDRPGLARDVDTPAQLAALAGHVVASPPASA